MKNTVRAAAAIAVLGLLAAIVTVRADAPKTETVQFPNGTGTVSGFLAVPDKPGRYPALVVIHEWWGLTDWVKEQTQKLAEQGYIALAVDLYRGQVTADPEVAHELMRGLPQDRAVSDLKAAFAYLATRKDVDRMVHGWRIFAATRDSRAAACGLRGELWRAADRSKRHPADRRTYPRELRRGRSRNYPSGRSGVRENDARDESSN